MQRLTQLEWMVKMLEDNEWDMEGKDRSRVADGLIYFAEGEDMIPDRVPGLGYLDDAIMIELVVQDLRHEIEAYEDFRDYRARVRSESGRRAGVTREQWLENRRKELHSRIRRRRKRGDSAKSSKRLRLFR